MFFLAVFLAFVALSIWLSPVFMGWGFYSYFFQMLRAGTSFPDLIVGAIAIWLSTASLLLLPVGISYVFFRRSARNLLIISAALSAWMVAWYFVSQPGDGQLFNPYTGQAMYRYYQGPGGEIEMFPLGYEYHPRWGTKLLKLEPEVVRQFELARQEKLRSDRLREEEERKRREAQALKEQGAEKARQERESARQQEERQKAEQEAERKQAAAEALDAQHQQELQEINAKIERVESEAAKARQDREQQAERARKAEEEVKRIKREQLAKQPQPPNQSAAPEQNVPIRAPYGDAREQAMQLRSALAAARGWKTGSQRASSGVQDQPPVPVPRAPKKQLVDLRDYIQIPSVTRGDLYAVVDIPASYDDVIRNACRNNSEPYITISTANSTRLCAVTLQKAANGNFVGRVLVASNQLWQDDYTDLTVKLCDRTVKRTKVVRIRSAP